MNYKTPEAAGISSANIQKYINLLEGRGLSTHSMIIARGDDIVFEKYWAPFTPDFGHRMYSITKSIVAIAVGFAVQEGYLSLDDPMIKFFPDELANQSDENMKNQTVRHMLMMATAKRERGWFGARTDDRVRFYFENNIAESRPSGTIFQYDSTGSFVLGALVERLVGMPFIDYLRPRLFDKIGVSKEAYCLKCPGGHSWGDSGMICTSRDMLLIARFMLNGGKWNGEQLLDEQYVKDATSRLIDNSSSHFHAYNAHGYGYLIWRNHDDSFSFNGMGCQFAICVPKTDIILIYNGDNQGTELAKDLIVDNFFGLISRTAQDEPLEENPEAQAELEKPLELMTAFGQGYVPFRDKINGAVFALDENPMGITRLSLHFWENGKNFLRYTNAQGDKEIEFGMCENKFGYFPQEGYSNEVGSVSTEGFFYKCAASAAWVEPQKLFIKVQIIDTYFGRLNIVLGFRDENTVGIFMNKTAEDFLGEYKGYAHGKRV